MPARATRLPAKRGWPTSASTWHSRAPAVARPERSSTTSRAWVANSTLSPTRKTRCSTAWCSSNTCSGPSMCSATLSSTASTLSMRWRKSVRWCAMRLKAMRTRPQSLSTTSSRICSSLVIRWGTISWVTVSRCAPIPATMPAASPSNGTGPRTVCCLFQGVKRE